MCIKVTPETFVHYIKAPPESNDIYTLFTHVNPSPEGKCEATSVGGCDDYYGPHSGALIHIHLHIHTHAHMHRPPWR